MSLLGTISHKHFGCQDCFQYYSPGIASGPRVAKIETTNGDPCVKRGSLKCIEFGVTSMIPFLTRHNCKAGRINLGEREVKMSKTGGINLIRRYSITKTVPCVRSLIVPNRPTVCRATASCAAGRRNSLTKTKASLAWCQAIGIRVSAMYLICLNGRSVRENRPVKSIPISRTNKRRT